MDALQYQEPATTALLVLSFFLLALHVVAWPLNRFIACGLLGQILIGTIWGTPVTSWLDMNTENAIVQLGFVGLILLVYEGGLTTDLVLLKETLVPSMLVAVTGIGLPIALSFILIPLFTSTQVSALTAFAAGASLSSTSLGTTFAILSAAKLANTRLGTVLVTAAMFDDVVGLVMVNVITSIGISVDPQTIARPIWVSVVLLILVILGSMIAKRVLKRYPLELSKGWTEPFSFVMTGTVLMGMTAAAGYAGTSVLFSVYLAGVSATYLSEGGALKCYTEYYAPLTKALLLPFFFASIGFAIPLRQMFRGGLLWRGIVYALLMAFAKCLTGFWLMVLPESLGSKDLRKALTRKRKEPQRTRTVLMEECKETIDSSSQPPTGSSESKEIVADPIDTQESPAIQSQVDSQTRNSQSSLYAAALLGLAMTTRGEIGFLVAAVAQSAGVIEPSDVYVVIIWGIVLCTLLGPIGVGILTRKAKINLGKWG